jgi:hypothetical protein
VELPCITPLQGQIQPLNLNLEEKAGFDSGIGGLTTADTFCTALRTRIVLGSRRQEGFCERLEHFSCGGQLSSNITRSFVDRTL